MFLGTRDPFDYVECAACGTLQIREVPDLAPYYPKNYYSYRPAAAGDAGGRRGFKERLSRRLAANYYGNRRNLLGKYLAGSRAWIAESFPAVIRDTSLRLGINTRSPILDVGAGQGHLLLALAEFGFTDLTGADPFIDSDIAYPNGVRVLRRQLTELGRRYDLVMMNHSFEHVPEPRRTLAELRGVLRGGRHAVVRMPVVAEAWRRYGVNWVQLDAPRHLFLFTAETFAALARESGFAVEEIVYDSTGFQFWGSEQYVRDIPLEDARSHFAAGGRGPFSPAELEAFDRMAAELNARREGDSAAFYLRKL
jgi:SAM-dependent methyltransferase